MDRNAVDELRVTRAIIGSVREHDLSAFEVWHWLGPIAGPAGRAERGDDLPGPQALNLAPTEAHRQAPRR
jgi:hypothetical protein